MITGAGGSIGVSMTRSLRDAGGSVRIVGTEANKYYICLSEADSTYGVPLASDDAYVNDIQKLVNDESIDVILPSNGWEVRAISENASQFSANTVLPDINSIDIFQNKWKLYNALSETDVSVPKTVLIESKEDIRTALTTVPTNEVWVRGIGIKGLPGRKMGDAEIIANWIEYHDAWEQCTISSYLPGDDLTWLGVFDSGELVCSQGRERIDYAESSSWGTGSPSVSRTIHDEAVNTTGRQAIEVVDSQPNGVYFTDMRADESGKPHVTEVNPGRLGTTSSDFYRRAGFNVAEELLKIATDDTANFPSKYNVLASDLYYIRKTNCEPVIITGDEIEHGSY